jgi:serine protease Do
MEEIQIIDAVERYIRGEMNPDERLQFEQLRKANAELDQLVVEHTLFLQQMNRLGDWQKMKGTLSEVHTQLQEEGKIDTARAKGTSKLVYLWNRYKRTAAIAASIAGITAISVSALVWTVSPKPVSNQDYQELDRKLNVTTQKTDRLEDEIEKVKGEKIPAPVITYKTVGTGFFIDANGLMITNAHVVKNSKNISVFNEKGDNFNAIVVKLDVIRDVAIIKIDDDKFKPFASLPYGISKSSTDIAEPVFTLGYPRDEIVYGEGYMSAKTGNNGDTLSCQISVPADPGNSGGPVFNSRGEVIGILSGKKTTAESAVFAVQSKYIYKALEELKGNVLYKNTKLSPKSSLAGMSKVQQVKKIQDYVFMVKGD